MAKPKIMIVDDEPDLLFLVKRYMEKWSFDVDAFDNPIKALAHFEKHQDDYSLVLTDIRMPSMSGIELAILMLQKKPNIRILVMTAYEISLRDLESNCRLSSGKIFCKNHSG